MKTPPPSRAWLLAASLLGAAPLVSAAHYALSLPSYAGRPGALVPVPLELGDASGLAGIKVKINFDPALLSVEAILPGALGTAFTLDHHVADGVATLVFSRTENLSSGAGRLGAVYFRVNAGATDALFSDLTLAEFSLCDSSGVIDVLGGANQVTLASGRLTVRAFDLIDNDADGLPDDWETTHGLDLLTDDRLADPDADGLPNLLEYAFGLNPHQAEPSPEVPGMVEFAGQNYVTLAFPRRSGVVPTLTYTVWESANLNAWQDVNLATNTLSTETHPNGTQTVTVRGDLPLTGEGAVPRAFLRLQVAPTTPPVSAP